MSNPSRRKDEYPLALSIARAVKEAGGRAFFVGGYVRDTLMGKDSKDIDIEVYGLTPAALRELLARFGEPYERGASFGVLGLLHSDIDIAMPRREQARGTGHKDFDIYVDPFLPVEKAASRRDFTVNALLLDPLTGEVIDCFGGKQDLEARVLRHVSDDSFPEDPLRVFRAARFSAVLGFAVAEETKALCRRIDVSSLSRERVFEETMRALLMAERPSVYFRFLLETGQLGVFFPELKKLDGWPQNPKHHPEGDVFVHTMGVVDGGASLRESAKYPDAFMLSCLMHDYGKPEATLVLEDGRIICPDHGVRGVKHAETGLQRLTTDRRLFKYVTDMVARHMDPLLLYNREAPLSETRRLLDASVCPEDLLLLFKADGIGKGKPQKPEKQAFWQERYREYLVWKTLPRVTGADLTALGFAPGTEMGALLKETYEAALGGMPREECLERIAAGSFPVRF